VGDWEGGGRTSFVRLRRSSKAGPFPTKKPPKKKKSFLFWKRFLSGNLQHGSTKNLMASLKAFWGTRESDTLWEKRGNGRGVGEGKGEPSQKKENQLSRKKGLTRQGTFLTGIMYHTIR